MQKKARTLVEGDENISGGAMWYCVHQTINANTVINTI